MRDDQHILLLGGSFEARHLAEALSARACVYEVWLSEAPRGAAQMPQIPLLRRFEGADAMQAAIAQGGFTAVIDAGHGFDTETSVQARQAAVALGLPYLRVLRAAWDPGDMAGIRRAADAAQASAMIAQGARVFCATGWDSLPDYAGFAGEVLMLRQTRRHGRTAPYPFVELVFGDPPFSVAQETALFASLRVDVLVCRNLGGAASRTKLDAAQALGLEVILIDRPAAPDGAQTATQTHEALAWLDAL